jgi:DNA-binding transcriptional LysR family regulator
MTANQIRQVVALADAGSFRHAALALKISQPSLSRAVSAVERELGVPLFDRLPRGVALTEFGRRVVAYGRTLIAAEGDLSHDLALLAGLETGRVSVAMSPYASIISGYAAAGQLLRSHPKLTFDLRVPHFREGVRAVLEREVDLGLTELAEATSNDALHTEPVGNHLARFFCRPDHPILARRHIGWQELLAYPWATTRLPARAGAAFRGVAGRAGQIDAVTGDFLPAIQLEVPMQIATFAFGTDALIVAGYGLVEAELRAGTLVPVPMGDVAFRAGYGFIWLRHRSRSPATLAYMKAVWEEERAFAQREAELDARYRPRTRRKRAAPNAKSA